MSFDLAVWYESAPLSHLDAVAKYEFLRRKESAGPAEHPGLEAFYLDLVARFPWRDSLTETDRDQAVWSSEPKVAGGVVTLSIATGAVTKVLPIIEEVAEREGLVCFDPERGKVQLPTTMTLLQMYGGVVEAVTEPSSERVVQAVAQTATARSHLILENGTQRYVQVSPALRGAFGVEYRDGGPDRHFRYETAELSEVVDIFDSYGRGDDSWLRYDWEPFQL